MAVSNTRCLATQTAEHVARLAQLRSAREPDSLSKARGWASETVELYLARLEHLRSKQALRLYSETEEQGQESLEHLRSNQESCLFIYIYIYIS